MSLPAATPCKDTTELRLSIIDASRRLSELGFCIATWGNFSVRVEEGLLITPSAIDYTRMTPADLVVCDWEGNRISGEQKPSTEMHLHRLLLLRRPEMGAVIHTHSPYASAAAAAVRAIPASTEDMAQIIGGPARCTEYVSGGLHLELAEAAAKRIGDDSAAVLLRNHGPVVMGRTLQEAVIAAQVLEKSAMLFVLAESLGGCVPLPEKAVREERRRFLFKYGREGE